MKSLCFLEVAEAEEIKWDKFPKLNNAGGFELLRVDGKQRCLEVIPIPPGGYTVDYLKDVIQQPIQTDLEIGCLLTWSLYRIVSTLSLQFVRVWFVRYQWLCPSLGSTGKHVESVCSYFAV